MYLQQYNIDPFIRYDPLRYANENLASKESNCLISKVNLLFISIPTNACNSSRYCGQSKCTYIPRQLRLKTKQPQNKPKVTVGRDILGIYKKNSTPEFKSSSADKTPKKIHTDSLISSIRKRGDTIRRKGYKEKKNTLSDSFTGSPGRQKWLSSPMPCVRDLSIFKQHFSLTSCYSTTKI